MLPRGGRRRYAVLAEGMLLDGVASKTAHGVFRYARESVAAVIDSTVDGDDLLQVLPELDLHAPIVRSLEDALPFRPTSLLVGAAPIGGKMPPAFRKAIVRAIDAGLEIVNGLHDFLTQDEELVARAQRSGAYLWDVRIPSIEPRVFTGEAYRAEQVVVLAVGTDCSAGKMTTMLELQKAGRRGGRSVAFAATGQTGIIIEGKGVALDRVISDFVAGAAEQLVLDVPRDTEFTLVEGQGALLHPAYGAVTLGLLFGSAPDLLLLCHRAGQSRIGEYATSIPSLREVIETYERIVNYVKAAPFAGIALNTAGLSEDAARSFIAEARAATGLPTDDVVRFGADMLWDVISRAALLTAKKSNI